MRLFFTFVLVLAFQNGFASNFAPDNFFKVDAHVLRGASPTQENIKWLANQGVKTIVKLDDENPEESYWGLSVEYYPINKFGFDLSYEYVKQILAQIELSSKKGLVYVHCEHGADRTGLIIALYRIQHGWSLDQARDEMNDPRFGHSSFEVLIDYELNDFGQRLENERGE
jgi:protein tyrosine/serine phosphatase